MHNRLIGLRCIHRLCLVCFDLQKDNNEWPILLFNPRAGANAGFMGVTKLASKTAAGGTIRGMMLDGIVEDIHANQRLLTREITNAVFLSGLYRMSGEFKEEGLQIKEVKLEEFAEAPRASLDNECRPVPIGFKSLMSSSAGALSQYSADYRKAVDVNLRYNASLAAKVLHVTNVYAEVCT